MKKIISILLAFIYVFISLVPTNVFADSIKTNTFILYETEELNTENINSEDEANNESNLSNDEIITNENNIDSDNNTKENQSIDENNDELNNEENENNELNNSELNNNELNEDNENVENEVIDENNDNIENDENQENENQEEISNNEEINNENAYYAYYISEVPVIDYITYYDIDQSTGVVVITNKLFKNVMLPGTDSNMSVIIPFSGLLLLIFGIFIILKKKKIHI